MASSATVGFGENESLEPPFKRSRRSDSPSLKTVEEVEVFKGSSDVPTTSQDDTGSYIFKQKNSKIGSVCFFQDGRHLDYPQQGFSFMI